MHITFMVLLKHRLFPALSASSSVTSLISDSVCVVSHLLAVGFHTVTFIFHSSAWNFNFLLSPTLFFFGSSITVPAGLRGHFLYSSRLIWPQNRNDLTARPSVNVLRQSWTSSSVKKELFSPPVMFCNHVCYIFKQCPPSGVACEKIKIILPNYMSPVYIFFLKRAVAPPQAWLWYSIF